MPMPKAAVDKNDLFETLEHKIRLAWEIGCV
jgi:hypothetical protein